MLSASELIARVKAYDPDADADLIGRAYEMARVAHGEVKRHSGELYFSHPVEVANILTDMRMDSASIATALLHDVVEDCDGYDLPLLQKHFGPEVARLVDGVTKLGQIELQPDAAGGTDSFKQAENFRKLVVAMSQDIRVLLVKLADRLHNMRTIHHVPKEEKRKRKARETLEIYAPLAERIGLAPMKDELVDFAFAQINPEERNGIVARLAFLRENNGDVVGKIIAELQGLLKANAITAEVKGREKTPYSIWSKLKKKNVSIDDLSDIMAFRIMVDTVEQCYQALGIIHGRYPVVPGRFKDYISTPKPNGYRSLHTTVLGVSSQRVEIQIRTRDMHKVSELGVAAHWDYKQGGNQAERDGPQYRWLRELIEIVENSSKPDEFLEQTRMALFQDQVFCFTPKGSVIALPQKATPVDFAYAVHSEVGDHCVSAKVNGRMVPLRHVLQNGDQVEILTSKGQTPSPAWDRFVVTAKARSRIRRFIRAQQRAQFADLGRAMLQKTWRQEGAEFAEKALEPVVQKFQSVTVEDLYAAVGAGTQSAKEIYYAVFPGEKEAILAQQAANYQERLATPAPRKPTIVNKTRGQPLPIRGLIPGMAVHYARCCHPLPGDRIVGIVTTGKGVTIHTIDCETLDSFSDTPERWLDVAWDAEGAVPDELVGRINVTIANLPGSLGTLSTVIGKNGGNITNLRITNRSEDFFDMMIDIDVNDVRHLTNIIAALRATPVINSVDRTRSR